MGWIDGHVHVWTPDTDAYPLAPGHSRDAMRPPSFTPEELLAHCRPSDVDRIVLIQMSFYGTDNRYLLDVIAAAPQTFRGVAVVDLEAADLPATMRELQRGGVRGYRVGSGGRDLGGWAEGPAFTTLFAAAHELDQAVCPLIEPAALPSLRRACERFPQTTVVIDHLCRIGIDGQVRDADVTALAGLAELPNVNVKVSAFYALGAKRPPHVELLPLLERMIEAYGVERLLWASDCPYQVQNETYEDGLSLVRDRLGLDDAARDQLLRGTAERIFFG